MSNVIKSSHLTQRVVGPKFSHFISFFLILSHFISFFLILSHFFSFYLILSHFISWVVVLFSIALG